MKPVIGPQETEQLRALRQRAEQAILTLHAMERIQAGEQARPGECANFSVDLPFGWRVVFCWEQQRRGTARHVSVSAPKAGRVANPETMRLILPLLGFRQHDVAAAVKAGTMLTWMEDLGEGHTAVNVLEMVERHTASESVPASN